MSDAEPTPEGGARRRTFDPRLAAIYATGALVAVLVVALTLTFVDRGNGKDPNTVDAATMQLGADNGSFTATTLPDAGLVTLDGTVTDLRAVAKGRPTMINFFSNSCTACRSEMPALQALHAQAGDKVQLVGVDLGDSKAVTRSFVDQTGVKYQIVRDPTLLLVERLAISAQPMTLWVDAGGKIVGHRYGALNATEMRTLIHDHLGISLPPA